MTRPGADDEFTELFIGAEVVLDQPAAPPDDSVETAAGGSPDR